MGATDAQLRQQDKLVKEVMRLFIEADSDNSNSVSWEEFESFMADEEIRAYFMALDLNLTSCERIFNYIDQDGSGHINLQQFVEGCLQLKGNAKMVDVTLLNQDVGELMDRLCVLEKLINEDLRQN